MINSLTPDDAGLGQYWLRQGLGASQHQAIPSPNLDLSTMKSSGIHLSPISQKVLKISVHKMSSFEKYTCEIPSTFLRGQWVKLTAHCK